MSYLFRRYIKKFAVVAILSFIFLSVSGMTMPETAQEKISSEKHILEDDSVQMIDTDDGEDHAIEVERVSFEVDESESYNNDSEKNKEDLLDEETDFEEDIIPKGDISSIDEKREISSIDVKKETKEVLDRNIQVNGSIRACDDKGNKKNKFNYKEEVYIREGNDNLTPGDYYVRVTLPNGHEVLGQSDGPAVKVLDTGQMKERYRLWDIVYYTDDGQRHQGYKDTTNPGLQYKVEISLDSKFQDKSLSRTDSFKVLKGSTPVEPERPKGRITIRNILLDEDGEVVLDENKEFEIRIDGPKHSWNHFTRPGNERSFDELELGEYVLSEPYIPYGYELVEIDNSQFELTQDNWDVTVTITNKKKREGWFTSVVTKDNIFKKDG